MQFIDLERLEPLIRDFLEPLEEAQATVTVEDDPDRRRALIEQHRHRWVALRRVFEEFSYNKCWYVECRNPGTDDDIDHFRPKRRVSEDPEHPGYYWLAFDWRNLRLSCHRANRLRRNPETQETGGKGDHFPILNPADRARTPAHDVAREQPTLLDPTSPTDPRLLWFRANGEVGLSPFFRDDLIAVQRFEATHRYLHLNWPRFCEERMGLYNVIRRTVRRGDREAPPPTRAAVVSDAFKDIVRDLQAIMHQREEYSAAARVYVESFRHVWWVRAIVLGRPHE